MSEDVKIRLETVRPKPHRTGLGNSELRFRVFYNDEELGVWRYPEGAAARKLVEMGVSRDAVLHVFHGSAPAMRGNLGWCADHTIREDDARGLRIVKYKPRPDFSYDSRILK